MPGEDFHLAVHARSQAHDAGFRRHDEARAAPNRLPHPQMVQNSHSIS